MISNRHIYIFFAFPRSRNINRIFKVKERKTPDHNDMMHGQSPNSKSNKDINNR